jgi:Zn-dependent protease with chaperone function
MQSRKTDAMNLPTPQPSIRDLVSNRDALLSKIEDANRWTTPLIVAQSIAIVVLIILIDWTKVDDHPLLYAGAVSVVVGPFTLSVLRLWAQNKKEIGDLKETTWFGDFDKHLLRDLFNDTLDKLQLPREELPVYVTADRTMNAMASHVGLGVLSKRFNGIYLHRGLLHKLTAAEVQDTMGHELGHYYAHYLQRTRYNFVSFILGGLLAIGVAQWLGVNSIIGYLALLSCASAAFYFSTRVRSDHMQAIEYLCDDFGAHTNGVAVAISALMKLGASSEVENGIFFESVLSKQFESLSPAQIMESLQQAIPYGHVSDEELKRSVDQQLKRRSQQGPSIAGFLQYAWQDDVDNEGEELIEQQARAWQKLRQSPRLPWESVLEDPANIHFSGESLEKLIALIEANPNVPLFHQLMPDHDERTHPPTKMRVLYLWYNREAIANSPALPSNLRRD